ncbi:hypothetical protein IWX49DRAFT_580677 [Phyllosticta citricarpa]|uniref:Uncharacterized protein n=1 Tax=Phyllosticta citricarpa TaxID=55181 RepID=A0ABR1LKM2_9PEZI
MHHRPSIRNQRHKQFLNSVFPAKNPQVASVAALPRRNTSRLRGVCKCPKLEGQNQLQTPHLRKSFISRLYLVRNTLDKRRLLVPLSGSLALASLASSLSAGIVSGGNEQLQLIAFFPNLENQSEALRVELVCSVGAVVFGVGAEVILA